jgi:hypothetical protein
MQRISELCVREQDWGCATWSHLQRKRHAKEQQQVVRQALVADVGLWIYYNIELQNHAHALSNAAQAHIDLVCEYVCV